MRELIRQRPILTFYILAFTIGLMVTLIRLTDPMAFHDFFVYVGRENIHPNIFSAFAPSLDKPVLFTGYLFPAAPTIAALIIVIAGWGVPGLKNLLNRFRPWSNDIPWQRGLSIYGITMVIFFALLAVFFSEVHQNGSPNSFSTLLERYGNHSFIVFSFLMIAPFLNHGALFEELGWRGYMQSELLDRYSPLKAVILIGIFWGLWHFPREIPGLLTYNDGFIAKHGTYFGFLVNQILFIAGTIATSICIMYPVNLTGGSVLIAILIHGMSNEFSVALSMGTGLNYDILGKTFDFQDITVFIIAILILIFAGPRLGYTPPSRSISSSTD